MIADNYNQGGNYGSYDGYRQGGRSGRGISPIPSYLERKKDLIRRQFKKNL
jgi:hypothetical protein